MNRAEYNDYVVRFNIGMAREGIARFDPMVRDEECTVEPHFSSQPCDICHTALGGNRTECCAADDRGNVYNVTFDVCDDCIYFQEYGRLDDMTMANLD